MEDLIISAKEHKLLTKFQKQLEQCYKVEIRMPEKTSLACDVVFISIKGTKQSINCVKKFLSEKMNLRSNNINFKGDVMIVTLSDSEDDDDETSTLGDSIRILEPSSCSENSSECRTKQTVCDGPLDDSVYIIETSTTTKDESVIMEDTCNQFSQLKRKRSRKRSRRYKKARAYDVVSSSDADFSEVCEVSSTTDNLAKETHNEKPICFEAVTSTKRPVNSIPFLEEAAAAEKENDDDDDVDVLILEPVPTIPSLRPIVIDGSNVAIEHGRVSHTFSSKGILLAINYFLSRGHTQVTAFVPRFRRICNPKHNYPTVDPAILDDLAEKQLVVFTPSRRINGKSIVPYDDRFIVQLAATNGGVIVSNDNYRDLLHENDEFKEAIENRLLMFCFVGDVFMVPEDPLGRDGPKLKEYLSFPPNPKT